MSKSDEDAIVIIDRMALNDHQGQYNKGNPQRKVVIIALATNDALLVYNKLLTQTMEELTK